jgi:hypothetical protein
VNGTVVPVLAAALTHYVEVGAREDAKYAHLATL